jgi:hypothetical protein
MEPIRGRVRTVQTDEIDGDKAGAAPHSGEIKDSQNSTHVLLSRGAEMDVFCSSPRCVFECKTCSWKFSSRRGETELLTDQQDELGSAGTSNISVLALAGVLHLGEPALLLRFIVESVRHY